MAVHMNPASDLFDRGFVAGSPVNTVALLLVRATLGKCRKCGRLLEDEEALEHEGTCPLFFARFVICPLCDCYHKLESPGVDPELRPRAAMGVLEPCADCSP